jgi:dihydrofolate reductase
MPKVIYSFSVSLDGFFETLDRSLHWVAADEDYLTFVIAQQKMIGAYLYGTRLYENMAAYWPTPQANDPANPPYVLEWARIWRATPKVVFSSTLRTVEWNSRLIRGDAIEEVSRLKHLPGNDLTVGGATLAASLIKHDLVDVYEVFVQPVILGAGTPYLPTLEHQLDLKLVEVHKFGSGAIQMRYERSR